MSDFWPRYARVPRASADDADSNWRFPGAVPKPITEGVEDYLRWLHTQMGGKFESPIEARMGGALYDSFRDLIKLRQDLIKPQFPIGPYRADFMIPLVKHLRSPYVGIVIECDGQEFHQSALQRRKDRERDAWMGDRGYAVMRFTGADIYRRSREAAASVREFYNECQPPRAVVNG